MSLFEEDIMKYETSPKREMLRVNSKSEFQYQFCPLKTLT